MTKTQIKQLAARLLSDSSYTHWTEAEHEDNIDRGYADFQDRTHTMRKHGTITLATDTAFYDLPTDLIYLHRVEDPNGVLMSMASTFYMDREYGTNWRETDTSTTVTHIITDSEGIADSDVDGDYLPTIRVFPIPDSNMNGDTLAIDYAYRLEELENADSPLFQAEMHIALVWYDLWFCYLKEIERQDLTKADYYEKRYMSRVRKERGRVAKGFVPNNSGVQIPWFV